MARGKPFGENSGHSVAHQGIEKAALSSQPLLFSGQSKVRAITCPSGQNTQLQKGDFQRKGEKGEIGLDCSPSSPNACVAGGEEKRGNKWPDQLELSYLETCDKDASCAPSAQGKGQQKEKLHGGMLAGGSFVCAGEAVVEGTGPAEQGGALAAWPYRGKGSGLRAVDIPMHLVRILHLVPVGVRIQDTGNRRGSDILQTSVRQAAYAKFPAAD